MKKIISLVALLAGIVFVTSCSSDDASYVPTPKLEIKSAQVLFDAEGGDGSIVLNTTGTVTATTDASWLSLAVQGNTVTVTANPNITLNGRSAVINLVSGDTQAQVTATQKGSTYGLESELDLTFNNDARTLSIPFQHPSSVQLKPLADWITASFDDATDEITVQIAKNESGWRRTGKLAIETAGICDTLTITQFDFIDDALGTYRFVYQSDKWSYTMVELERIGNTNQGQIKFLSGTYAANGFTIPVEFDADNECMYIYNLAEMGGSYTKSGVNYSLMLMVMGLSADNKIYRFNNDKIGVVCKLEEVGTFVRFVMEPNSQFDSSKYSLYGLRIGYTTGGYSGYVGAVTTFPNCYLLKD